MFVLVSEMDPAHKRLSSGMEMRIFVVEREASRVCTRDADIWGTVAFFGRYVRERRNKGSTGKYYPRVEDREYAQVPENIYQ